MKRYKVILMFFIALFVIIKPLDGISALLTSITPSSANAFTIKQIQKFNVTYKYSYIDENDVKHSLKSDVVEEVDEDTIITLGDNIDNSVDYDQVKYFIDEIEYNNSSYVISEDVVIEEVYYLNRYTITYNLNNGTLTNPITTYTSMTETFNLPTPTRNGYTFKGWSQEHLATNPAISAGTQLEMNEIYDTGTQGSNHIYIRVISGTGYAMNVDYNGTNRVMVYTDDSSSAFQYSTDGTNWTTISNWNTVGDIYYQYFTLTNGSFNADSGIADPGITYTEFSELADNSASGIAQNPFTVTKGSTGDIEVSAKWVANQTYTLTLYRNRSTNDNTTTTQTFASGEPQNIMTCPWTRNGYTFAGWATSRNGSVVYQPGEEITLTSNMTLYAKWT